MELNSWLIGILAGLISGVITSVAVTLYFRKCELTETGTNVTEYEFFVGCLHEWDMLVDRITSELELMRAGGGDVSYLSCIISDLPQEKYTLSNEPPELMADSYKSKSVTWIKTFKMNAYDLLNDLNKDINDGAIDYQKAAKRISLIKCNIWNLLKCL